MPFTRHDYTAIFVLPNVPSIIVYRKVMTSDKGTKVKWNQYANPARTPWYCSMVNFSLLSKIQPKNHKHKIFTQSIVLKIMGKQLVALP
jgi:hypothetical protein